MNGGLQKMDHEEMRAAYLRAIDIDRTDFTHVCNICKQQYIQGSGEIIDIVTYNKVYKIWNCPNCIDEQIEVTC